jgi:hypothetical protein
MLRIWVHSGLMAAGLALALPSAARAAGPSEKCRDGAAQCREAFAKLEKCQHAGKKEKPAVKEAKAEAGATATKEAKESDACTSERSETDSACKTTNSACVKDGSRHAPHARKG